MPLYPLRRKAMQGTTNCWSCDVPTFSDYSWTSTYISSKHSMYLVQWVLNTEEYWRCRDFEELTWREKSVNMDVFDLFSMVTVVVRKITYMFKLGKMFGRDKCMPGVCMPSVTVPEARKRDSHAPVIVPKCSYYIWLYSMQRNWPNWKLVLFQHRLFSQLVTCSDIYNL
jgi:hypothetical protein